MSNTLKIIRLALVLLSVPGIAVTLFGGAGIASLLWAEFFPDPADIAHGMAMAHAFVPMIAWAIIGLMYLFFLWLLWFVARKVFSAK